MRDGEILKKAFEQAEKAGYKWDGKFESFDYKDGSIIIHDNAFLIFPIEVFLFDPEFAKAFFGKEVGIIENEQFIPDEKAFVQKWQYYIGEMVLKETREERIKFLEEFIK